jgi:hypothetical protein
MYKISYFITLIGLFGMSMWHPEPRFQCAILLLLFANALFLWA